VHEPESEALLDYLEDPVEAVTSALSLTEAVRALRRHGADDEDDPEGLLEAFVVLHLTPAICRAAAALDPPALRSLDAIHLATALSTGAPDLELITYDDQLARAAGEHGLTIVQPGRAQRASR